MTNVDRVRCFCPDTNYDTLSVNPHRPGARSHVITLQRTCKHYWENYQHIGLIYETLLELIMKQLDDRFQSIFSRSAVSEDNLEIKILRSSPRQVYRCLSSPS